MRKTTTQTQISRPGYKGRVCGYCRRMRILDSGPYAGTCEFCGHAYSWQQERVRAPTRDRRSSPPAVKPALGRPLAFEPELLKQIVNIWKAHKHLA
jgi:hypothetical protein